VKALITGASGQVGQCVQDVFARNKIHVVATTRSELDITNEQNVTSAVEQYAPRLVINTAAYTAVDEAERNTQTAYLVNQKGCENLAKICSEFDIPLIHISTDYVFAGNASRPYTEESQTSPQSIYGESKLAGEHEVIRYAKDYCILRTAWVFSEYRNNFLKTMLRLGKERGSLRIVSDQIGCPTYAGDIANSIFVLANKMLKSNFESGIYNYCGDQACSWYEFADEIFSQAYELDFLEKQINLEPINTSDYPTLAKRPQYSVLDCTKIQNQYAIQPSDWRKAITTVIQKLN